MIRVTFEDEERDYKATIEEDRELLRREPIERMRFNCMVSHKAGKLLGKLRDEVKEEKKK